MKKVVVTGALGFIGFSLSLRLLEKGIEVIGIDGMIDEQLKELQEEKLLWLGRNSSFQFINKKIEDSSLEELFKDIDVVYHLAAATNRNRNWGVLRSTIEDNVGVTGKIIAACEKSTKIIYTSSIQVYGERAGIITEKTPLNPITPYSLTKMAAESLIQTKCKELNVPYVIFRLPTIYGPWQRLDMTYCKLIINKLTSRKSEVDLDRVTEDVLYIDDILDTLIKAGLNKDCQNEVFNVSTGKTNEWYRGRAMITKELNDEPKDERLLVRISNEKVGSELGFQTSTDLASGIKQQTDHIKKYRHLYVK